MQAVLCDACNRRILGDALEVHLINGFAVKTESGARISQRRGSMQIYLCTECGRWLQLAYRYLCQGHAATRAAGLNEAVR